ncbi:hypothetical protein [Lutimonas sp.]|uniref:hypothetical protein n=1 Tax=Lutimonas sp. TaxID=1872403 RepID=UPI003D9B05A8
MMTNPYRFKNPLGSICQWLYFHSNTLLFVFLLFFYFSSIAQEDQKQEKSWNFTAAPYLIFPSMNGDVGLGNQLVNVDANPGDIFENLDGGFMFFIEASKDKWIINVDFLFMNLGAKGTTPLLQRDARVDLQQLGLTFNGMYQLNNWLSAGIGFRVNSINQSFNIQALAGPGPGEIELPEIDRSLSNTWVDPLLVARAMTRFNDSSWRLGMIADIGGFGIGSDLAWQVNPFVGYQFSKLFEIDLAYRWLAMDYNTGKGQDYFLYNMVISGPEIGFLFHF